MMVDRSLGERMLLEVIRIRSCLKSSEMLSPLNSWNGFPGWQMDSLISFKKLPEAVELS